jgi:hypothetical protein
VLTGHLRAPLVLRLGVDLPNLRLLACGVGRIAPQLLSRSSICQVCHFRLLLTFNHLCDAFKERIAFDSQSCE